jgi:DNA-binding transcriptional MerR regulator
MQEKELKYFKIGNVEKLLGVPASTIRFWLQKFQHIKPLKSKGGENLFTTKNIEELKEVYYLTKEKGYTLEGAKDILFKKRQKVSSNMEIYLRLKDIKKELMAFKKELDS